MFLFACLHVHLGVETNEKVFEPSSRHRHQAVFIDRNCVHDRGDRMAAEFHYRSFGCLQIYKWSFWRLLTPKSSYSAGDLNMSFNPLLLLATLLLSECGRGTHRNLAL